MTARAKVNLTLEVLGRRPDGFHDLRSFVMPISLCDWLSFAPAADVTLAVTCGPDVQAAHLSAAEDNLVVRAVRLLQRLSGRRDGVAVTLEKRIPVGAGLGGGSADAAATLVGLNDFWKLGLSRSDLADASAALGSDIPALVTGGLVLMEGRGERVSSVPCTAELVLVLAFPGVFTATGKVYAACVPQLTNWGTMMDNMRLALSDGDPAAVAAALENGLAPAAESLHPEIARARVALRTAGALGASMTGSGSCVFGVARDETHARQIAARVNAGGLRAVCVRTCPVM